MLRSGAADATWGPVGRGDQDPRL